MSADDFQTKYSSVMEGMLKGAIAETTKLFETMVDELKSEISRMKKENDDLKIRCSQFENARNQPSALTREADPVRGPSEVSGKRDRAVQCDLVPVRTMLVEQFQPLRPSSRQNQEQHCTYDETYSLQDHTYGEGTTQMAMLFVKQGSYDSSQLVVKREETEPTVSGLVLSDEAGSLQASAIAAENEGILELPPLARDSLQKAQKPSSELGNSQVLSIAETKGNFEDSEFMQMDKLITSEKHPFVVARQRVGVSQQHCVGGKSTEQQLSPPTPLKKGQTWEQLKNGVAQIGGSLKPEWADSRRRRPSKKAELMQHPLKEIGSLTVSEKTCSFEKEKPSESQHKSMATEDGAVKAPFNEILSANKTLNPSNVHPKERCTSVTLQDAILLVEAMNQSTEEDPLTTVQQTEAPPRTQFSPCVGPLVIVDEIPTASTQMAKEKIGSAPVASEASNEAPGHITVVMPKQSHTVTPSNTTTPSTTAGKRSGPSQQHLPHPLTTSSVSSKCDQKASHELVSQPRSVSSTICHKIEAPSLAQLPSVVSAVVAAQKSATLPCFPKATQSIPQKSTQITSVPSVLSQSTTTSTDLQSEIPARPNIRIIIPGTVSKTIVPTSKQESTKSDAFRVSSPQFIPSSKDVSIFVDTQTVLEEVAAISSKKKYKILCSEVPKPTAPVCELVNAVTQTCSISNPSVKLKPTSVSVENNLSAVVRLTRLPFPISANEAVIVSRLGTYGSSGSQSVLKEDTQGKESPVAMSTPPPQTPGLAAGDCTKLKETSFAVLGNTTQMSDEPDKIQENASLLFENCTFLEGDPTDSRPSTTIKTGQLAGNYTASCSDEEMINIAMQDLASSSDAAVAAKGSAVVVHLTPITSKNIADLHLNMTKTQFLAQLAVTPAPECSQKVSSDDSVKARAAETGTSKTQGLQNNSLVARLRSHLKTHPHARRTDPNSATETCPVTPKKGVIENVNPKGKDGTRAPSPMSPKDPRSFGNITFSEKIGLTPVDLLRSGDREAGVGPEKTAGEPSLIHSTISKATRESAPVSPRRSGVRLKARQSTRKEAAAMKECVSPKKSKPTSVSPRRYISIKVSPGFQKTKSTSVSPKRCSAIKERDSPIKTRSTPSPRSSKMTKNLSASPRWINSTTDGACPKSTIATSLGPKRTSSCRDGAIPKKAKSTVGQEKSILIENGTSPKVSIDESNSFCRRRCTLPKDGSSGKQNNGESVSFSPSNGITPDRSSNKDAKSVTAVGRWPKSVKSVSPRMTRDTASAKKPRLMLDGTGPKQKLMLDAEDLANVGKAKKIAKLKNCNQSKLLNGVTGAKTGQSAESRASCETGRKGTAKAVWTPPRLSTAIKTPPVGANQEPSSPSLQTLTLVYPPSVALLPIPVRAPPVVSPLQPLSVIGRRLLKNQCGECGRVLSSAASLESHVSLHAGRRPFSCTLCGKRFPDSRGLKRHGRVHRNGRIHICHQCGKGFVYSFGLTKHLQMVHRKIKPFMCQICNKGFFSKRDLEAHMRIHTGEKPFHCTLCEKKFARRVELNVHLRWHNGEKRHWCPFCGKGFLDFNNMKRHKFTHTGEKPHSCPHCPKRFTQSGHLKKHVKNVHKIQ